TRVSTGREFGPQHAVSPPRLSGFSDLGDGAAVGGHAIQRRAKPEYDDALRPPGARPRTCRYVADGLWRTARDGNPFELRFCKKCERPAVGRPEGRHLDT